MSQVIQRHTSGSFVLQITYSSGPKYYIVKSFQLTKAVGSITMCTVAVGDITRLVQIRDSGQYPKKNVGQIAELYQAASDTNTNPLPCRLLQYNTRSQQEYTQWFTGRVCVVTPSISTAYGVAVQATCMCLGKACQLMYNYILDFRYAAANTARNMLQAQKQNVIGLGGQLMNAYTTDKMNLQQLAKQSGQNIQTDTVDLLFSKPFSFIQAFRNRTSSDKQVTPVQLDLLQYLESQYMLGDYIRDLNMQQNQSGISNTYIKSWNQQFTNGLSSAQIWDAIRSVAMSQRFLTFIPAARQDTEDKLKIVPSYIQPYSKDSGLTVQAKNLVQATITASPIQHLGTPDVLYINMSSLTAYDSAPPKPISGVYGKYVSPASADKDRMRVKQVSAPHWLLSLVVQRVRQTKQKQEPLLNTAKGQKPDKTIYDVVTRAKDNLLIMKALDQYAKTVFYSMYYRDKQANIVLMVTDSNKDIDKYLGQSIILQMPVDQNQLNKNEDNPYKKFYGVLANVIYSYGCSQGPGKASYLNIRAQVTGITSVDSAMASIFTQDTTGALYKKKGK